MWLFLIRILCITSCIHVLIALNASICVNQLWYASDSILDGLDTKHSDVSFSIANRLEKCYGGKAYVGLRIPDPDTSTRQHIEIVLVTKREVMVVAVRSYSGLVDAKQDGSWICIKDSKRTETHPDPVLEVTKQLKILEAYLEQRGVVLPKGHLVGRVVLPNPNCRTAHSIDSQPEIIPFEKWKQLQSESKSGFSSWIKDAFHGGKSEMQDDLHQKLNSIFSTSPMWDRLECKGVRSILGEFIEFQGNQDDMKALRHLKRSKVSQIVIQKTTLFGAFGRSRIHVLYTPRDYRSEGSSASEWKEVAVKPSTEVVFQPLNAKKSRKFKLSSVISLTLSA